MHEVRTRWQVIILVLGCSCTRSGSTEARDEEPKQERAPSPVRVDHQPPPFEFSAAFSLWIAPSEVRVVRGIERAVAPASVVGRVDPAKAEEHLLPPVKDGVARIIAETTENGDRFVSYFNALPAKMEHPARLVIDTQVPFSTIVDSLYSIGKAGSSGLELVVAGPDGPGSITAVPPVWCKRDQPREGPTCVVPRLA